ncbi:MAG: aspartate aminotransferase family protein, partial [Actinomycetota bacterium]|nr:aspartate aminotransferase family protein [Actinomycetota bacterium]
GLPLWFSLATHGSNAYTEAIETTLRVTREGALLIEAAPHTELLLEPELSVLLFRRVGWEPADYAAWSDALLAEQVAFVTPTSWHGETVLRLCVVNPLTTADDIALLIERLA